MFTKLKNFSITTKEKSVYAFLVGAIGSYMAQSGLTWHEILTTAGAKALLVGVLSHQLVYWVENAKELDASLKENKDIATPKFTTIQTQIELKIPEGWVFVRVGKPKIGEWFLRLDSDGTKQPHKCDTEFVHSKIIVKKKEWEWPSKITPGEWIAMDAGGHWFYSSEEPLWVDGGWWCPVEKTCKFLIGWAKPDCKDITESKRQRPRTIKSVYGYIYGENPYHSGW